MQRHVSQYYFKYKDYLRLLMCPQTSYSAHVVYQLRDQIGTPTICKKYIAI